MAPNSQLFELLEQARKTGSAEDQKKVKEHAKEIDMKFIAQCELPGDYRFRPWNIGQGYDVKEKA